eukprot:TRINITY_DN8990_c0_g1_i1.p1 TRINITY_DN8990_c0_g1~~TRINITY_DN8990_c0_g1_i1.p1  ORF type:complete len:289 (+),score=105.04 TRINITY_DN8990_c0_g1_i1:44-910(+)
MLKLSKKLYKNKKIYGGLFTAKRNYASDHHHEVKNECYISESYTQKWGFLTDQEQEQWDQDIERDLKEISERHERIREEKIKSWTPAQMYPWYTPQQLKEREEKIEENKKYEQYLANERNNDLEREKKRGPFDPTLESTFGNKSREVLWKRFFARYGNNAPPQPKATIRVTTDAPFDTSDWQFFTEPIHCDKFQELEQQRLHPTRRLVKKYLYFWVDNGFKQRGTEYTQSEIESFDPATRKRFDSLLKEYNEIRQELDELLPINIERIATPIGLPSQEYVTFINKLDI